MEIAGIPIFPEMTGLEIAALAAIYASAFMIKGVFGFGAVPLMIVGGTFVVEAHHAVVLAAISNLMTHVQLMPNGIRHGRKPLVLKLAIFVLPAIILGVWIFGRLSGPNLSVLAGAIILMSMAMDQFRLLDPLHPLVRRHQGIVGPVFGTITGLIAGVVGAASIAFVSLYIRAFVPGRQEFRSTLILLIGIVLMWRISVLGVSGHVTTTILIEAALLLPFGLVAGYLGSLVTERLSDGDYFTWYRAALSFGAILMIYRGLSGGA
jgi:uncharacterized membrane protein YfcA